MDCNRIPNAENWDDASAQQLNEYRSHIKFCLACRRRVFSESPIPLLSELKGEPMPDEFWIGFWDSLENKLPPADKRYHLPLLPVVRWAAALIVALLLALYQNKLPESPSYEISRGGSPIRPFDLSKDTLAKDPSLYPLVEEVKEPGSTYAIFEADHDQKIVMIFNPDIEL
jgi:hypothetical protein